MSRLVIGGANFNQKYGINKTRLNEKDLFEILKSKKVNFIDTSFEYNQNKKFLDKFNLKNYKIITKVKLPDTKKKYYLKKIESKILDFIKIKKIKKFEAVLFHNVDDLKNKYGLELLSILKSLKDKSAIKNIGVSIYEPEDLKYVFKLFTPEIVQFPLNIFDQSFIKHSYYKKLKNKKTILQARSIFLQGLVLKDLRELKKMKINKKLLSNLCKFDLFCKKKKLSKLEACIFFINSIRDIDLVTFGFNNKFEFNQVLNTFKKKKIMKFPKLNLKKKFVDPRKW